MGHLLNWNLRISVPKLIMNALENRVSEYLLDVYKEIVLIEERKFDILPWRPTMAIWITCKLC